MMDMDIEDEALVNNLKNLNESRPSALVFVDDAHPFDLEAYISNYTGMVPLFMPIIRTYT
jgi:hypothetical protein